MKYLFSLIFILSGLWASAADTLGLLPLKNGKVFYSGTIHSDCAGIPELFTRAHIGLIDAYPREKSTVLFADKEEGFILSRSCFGSYSNFGLGFKYIEVWQKIKIYVKEDRIRYEISDFEVRVRYDSTFYETIYPHNYSPVIASKKEDLQKHIDQGIREIIFKLEDNLRTRPSEDW